MTAICRASILLALIVSPAFGKPPQLTPTTFAETGDTGAVVRIDVKKHALKVISAKRLMSERGWTDPTAEKLGPLLKSKRFILISGGLHRENPIDPAGLLVADGKVLAPLADSTRSKGEITGVLCISDDGRPSILTIKEYRDRRASCTGAVQAGPIVVFGREAKSAELPGSRPGTGQFPRLVACEMREPGGEFAFYFFDSTTIARVRQALQARCVSAINLTGSNQASISVWQDGAIVKSIGQIDVPLPSMIRADAR